MIYNLNLFFVISQGFTFPVTQFYLEDVLEKTRYRVSSESGGGRSSYQDRRNPDKKDVLSQLFEVHKIWLQNHMVFKLV